MDAHSGKDLQRPLRILLVFRAPVGGLFRNVMDLAKAQIARGHEVGIFCDSTTGGERGNAALAGLAPALALGLTRAPMSRYPSLNDVRALATVRGLVAKHAPDVVHGHGSKGGLYARLPYVLRRGVAVTVYTPHGGSFNYRPGSPTHWLYMRAEKLLERGTDLYSFESEYIAGRFAAYVGETARMNRVIWNGLHDHEFEPVHPNPDASDFVYIGEFRSAKGIDTLIEALRLVSLQNTRKPTLTMVGSGPDESDIRAALRQSHIAASVTMHPPMSARDAMKLGRAMVVPSRAESLPYVILEAAAAQVPLIATAVGGVPEIFGPHAQDLIQPDRPDMLADAMQRAMAQSCDAARIKAAELAGFVRTRFSVDRMTDAVIAGYRAAMTARG